MKILVTDGNTLPALAITRSLGRLGHDVIVGYQDAESLAGSSKYCSYKCVYPNPVKDTQAFVNFIIDFVEFDEIDAIFPVTDITTLTITKHKNNLPSSCKIPFAEYDVISTAANKAIVFEYANKLDIDTPKSIVINDYKQLNDQTIDISYPLVIKPSRSRVLTNKGWVSTVVTYAESYSELDSQLSEYQSHVFPVILQEKIVGPGLGIFMCYDKGIPVAAFCHKRLREKPPSGGVSVLRESVPLDPLAYEFSERLLSKIKWSGVVMVEYKIDIRDQRPKLMEINGRFWGSLQLAIDAGVDFPKILADGIQNKNVSIVNKYKYGVKSRWLWGDIDALLIRIFKSSEKQLLPEGSDSKLVYFLKFMKLWEPNLNYDVLRLSDLRPWIYESIKWFKRLI